MIRKIGGYISIVGLIIVWLGAVSQEKDDLKDAAMLLITLGTAINSIGIYIYMMS